MPQNGVNTEVRRKEARRITRKAIGLVSGQVPRTGLVNGVLAHNGCPVTGARIKVSAPEGILNGTKPHRMVNGSLKYGHQGRSSKAALRRTTRKQGGTISAVTDASAAGRVGGTDISAGISVRGATSLDAVALPGSSEELASEPSVSAAVKKQRRRRRRFISKKRGTEFVRPEKSTLPAKPPPEEEDWENEIQEVTLTDCENMGFGARPYGPEDVLHFALGDMTLVQKDTVDLPVTANYSPVAHHPHPIQWICHKIPTEPDQFVDAED